MTHQKNSLTEQDEDLLEDFLGGYETLSGKEVNRLVSLFDLAVSRVDFENGPIWTLCHGDDLYILEKDSSGQVDAMRAVDWLDHAIQHASDYVTYPDELATFWTDHGIPPQVVSRHGFRQCKQYIEAWHRGSKCYSWYGQQGYWHCGFHVIQSRCD